MKEIKELDRRTFLQLAAGGAIGLGRARLPDPARVVEGEDDRHNPLWTRIGEHGPARCSASWSIVQKSKN